MKILVSALEPSSNLHLSEVLKHTKDIELFGIFDNLLDKSRSKPLYDISDMAIMGVVDAIKKLRWFFKVADEMVELASQVDKILLMDSSGFNLPLAKRLKKRYPDKEIIYYILPQVWVTRPKRVKKIERYCDRLLGILPFEIEYYSSKAHYVGHPLLDEIDTTSYISPKDNTISYLPGSRRGEISKLMPIYRELRERLPLHRAILVVPSSFGDDKIAELYGDTSGFEISRDTHTALQISSFAYICSGTATLEAALIGTPFTLNYIAKGIDYFIGTKILGLKQIGLANIIFERYNSTTLHSEIIQDEVRVENLLLEYENFDRELFALKSKELKEYLSHGSSANVAKILEE